MYFFVSLFGSVYSSRDERALRQGQYIKTETAATETATRNLAQRSQRHSKQRNLCLCVLSGLCARKFQQISILRCWTNATFQRLFANAYIRFLCSGQLFLRADF